MRPNWPATVLVSALVAALIAWVMPVAMIEFSRVSTNAEVTSSHSGTTPNGTQIVNAPKHGAANGSTPSPVIGAISPNSAGSTQTRSEVNEHTGNANGISEWPNVAEHLIWPLTLLAAIAFIAFNARLARILGLGVRLIRKISAGGVEIEINSETVDRIQRQLHESFDELVESAADEYERIASIQDIPEFLKLAVQENLDVNSIPDLRATIHIRDVIFPDYLYQIVDYYPSGTGAHRRFSQRYGIIGRSWRTKRSHGTGDAFAGAGGSVEALVEHWGMTQEEAQGQVHARPSCLSVIVRHHSIAVGILFMDSTERNAFGDEATALTKAQAIEGSSALATLGKALLKSLVPLRAAAPTLRIEGPAR